MMLNVNSTCVLWLPSSSLLGNACEDTACTARLFIRSCSATIWGCHERWEASSVTIVEMRSIINNDEAVTRPRGVVWLAGLFVTLAMLMLVYGSLLATSHIAFTQASWLIGIDAARMGPVVFVVGALVYVACAVGLLRTSRWARWLAILLIAAGLAQQVPAVSAAVTEFHLVPLAREGLLFMARMVCLYYLLRDDVREAFESR
jgi:hypothetical protein